MSEEKTLETLRLCLERGVDVNAVNDSATTALHMAVGKADAVIRVLAERGARLDAKDVAGRTPFDIARGIPGKDRQGRPARPGPVHEASVKVLRELSGAAQTAGPPQ